MTRAAHDRVQRLAEELAECLGTDATTAIIAALQSRLAALRSATRSTRPPIDVSDIQEFVRIQPERDARDAAQVLEYDQFGLPA